MRLGRRFLVCGLFACGALSPALAAPPPPDSGAAAAAIVAIWKLQKIDFYYNGRTARYSCDGLSDKVRMLLTRLGARSDLNIRSYGCEIGRIELHNTGPGLKVEFFAPMPRTAAGEESDGAPIEARFEPFVLEQDSFRYLDVGDCELIEAFARQVLPKFVSRAVKQDFTCILHQSSAGSYSVRGEILKAVTAPTERR